MKKNTKKVIAKKDAKQTQSGARITNRNLIRFACHARSSVLIARAWILTAMIKSPQLNMAKSCIRITELMYGAPQPMIQTSRRIS
jgi:hypothetical protein